MDFGPYNSSMRKATAINIKTARNNTSNVVGKIMTRIPWKQQNGIINWVQAPLIVLNHGGSV